MPFSGRCGEIRGDEFENTSSEVPKCKTEIELKSLILAQIERWRHALHMQVERGKCLHLSSGERVSNASERTV